MTDARLPDRWLTDPRYYTLSQSAWRTFTFALMLSAGLETDGHLELAVLRRLVPEAGESDLAELVRANLLKRLPDAVLILEWGDSQSTAVQLRAGREFARARQRRYRDKKRRDDEPP